MFQFRKLSELADLFDTSKAEKDKQFFFDLLKDAMITVGFPKEINLGILKYDTFNKAKEEIDKLTPETVEKALTLMKEKLSHWP